MQYVSRSLVAVDEFKQCFPHWSDLKDSLFRNVGSALSIAGWAVRDLQFMILGTFLRFSSLVFFPFLINVVAMSFNAILSLIFFFYFFFWNSTL